MKILNTVCGLEIKVDDEDYDYLVKFKWFRLKNKNTTYARTNFNGKTKVITHVLANYYNWDLNNKVIDHINKDGLDNQKINLKIVTQQQNISKDSGWKKSSSKYRGVRKFRNKWLAEIYMKGQKYYLGVHETEEQANSAVLNKRKEIGY